MRNSPVGRAARSVIGLRCPSSTMLPPIRSIHSATMRSADCPGTAAASDLVDGCWAKPAAGTNRHAARVLVATPRLNACRKTDRTVILNSVLEAIILIEKARAAKYQLVALLLGFGGESLVYRNGPLDSRRLDQELV